MFVRIERDELRELVVEAWMTRAQKRVAKAWLAEHEPGPGFYHFPEGTPEEYFNQLTAEKFRTKLHKGHEIVVWEKKSDQRNEVLDCEVLCLAGLTYLRPSYQRLATRLAVSSIGVTSKARVAEERMHDPLTRDAQRVKPRRGGYLNRWREV